MLVKKWKIELIEDYDGEEGLIKYWQISCGNECYSFKLSEYPTQDDAWTAWQNKKM